MTSNGQDVNNKLPALPLPHLNDSLEELKRWIAPLVQDDEFIEFSKTALHFSKAGGVGEVLHSLLETQRNDGFQNVDNASWLKPHWEDMYFSYRDRLVSNMNYFVGLHNEVYRSVLTHAQCAAVSLEALTLAHFSIVDGQAHRDVSDGGNCTQQLDYIFDITRIPKKNMDWCKAGAKSKANAYWIVSFRNNLFELQVSNASGDLYPIEFIQTAIEHILQSDVQQQDHGFGVFTLALREKSAAYYRELSLLSNGRETLDLIESALGFMALDEGSYEDEEWVRNLLLHGQDRYYDKSIQCLVSADKRVGFNLEHSMVDGLSVFPTLGKINQAIIAYTDSLGVDAKVKSEAKENHSDIVRQLKYSLPSSLKEKAKELTMAHNEFIDDLIVIPKVFSGFGSRLIKAAGMSPDAFFHIALQIAQYRVFGILGSTYESVSMSHYYEGRTECARPLNETLKSFILELESVQDREILTSKLRMAAQAHVERLIQCKEGRGVERYFFALNKILDKNKDIPDAEVAGCFFNSQAYRFFKTDFLSTSSVRNDEVQWFGFGPVITEGFGLSYHIKPYKVEVVLSCTKINKNHAPRLLEEFEHALSELAELTKVTAE